MTRILLLLIIVLIVIMAIVAIKMRGQPKYRLVIGSLAGLLAGTVFALIITAVMHRNEASADSAEIGDHEYGRVVRWEREFPELKAEIEESLADDKITWGEFRALEQEVSLQAKQKLKVAK